MKVLAILQTSIYKAKDAIRAFSVIIPSYLSCISIRSKKIYVFGAWFGNKYADNSRALFEYAIKHDGNVNYVWITKNKALLRELRAQSICAYKATSLKGLYYQLKAGVAVYCVSSADLLSRVLGGAIHINLWHGVGGGKKIGYDAEMFDSIYDRITQSMEKRAFKKRYYVSTSTAMGKVFKSAFHTDDEHIILAGQPRNDMFFDPDYEIKSFHTEIFNGKKVITYLPTHRLDGKEKIDCSSLFDFPTLNKFCKAHNCIFLIKKHFYYYRHEIENVTQYSNILDWTQKLEIDTNELLMVTDYLISDYSSVTADYLLLKRPIFYYCYDLEKYLEQDRGMYWPYNEITPGPKCRTFNELMKAMSDVIEDGKDEYIDERERVLSMFYGPQARKMVSQDILEAVQSIIQKEAVKK